MGKNNKPSPKTSGFATRFGVIAATVGSAVGLGNIWRFPYEAGVHGGGAFLLIYVLFIAVMGIPVICAEFIIGRKSHRNVNGAFKALSRGRLWRNVGIIGLVASVFILGFYSVVAGWTMEYLYQAIAGFDPHTTPGQFHEQFDTFCMSPLRPLVWIVLFLGANYWILQRGVQRGIEKMSNILMPLLFIIMGVLCVNSLTLSGAGRALDFLFNPDFSAITPSVFLGAMGQAFFSLSLGLGCLITYSAYFSDRTPLLRSASITAALDTLTALLAGLIIFPAVFTFNAEPAAGPRLVFEVLPSIFATMAGGQIWAILFYALLFVASLTSSISMCEISIAYLTQERGMGRRSATAVCMVVGLVLGVLSALSFGVLGDFHIFGLIVFNFLDYASSNVLLPVGGILISVFVGWVMPRSHVWQQLQMGQHVPTGVFNALRFCMRYIAPALILTVFIAGLL